MAVGADEGNGSVVSAWAGALPTAGVAPARPPIVLACDDALVRTSTRAAVRASLLGLRGAILVVLAAGFGYLVVAGDGAAPWWQVALAATGLYLLQALTVVRGLGRAMRRMLPPGGSVRSWYAAPDLLAVETGGGRTDLRPGSLQSAGRRGAVTSVRLRRNRRRGFLPSALLTDEDLAFLLAPAATGAPPPSSAVTEMPLILVVTAGIRRDLRRAVVAWTVRRPQMVLLLGCSALLVAVAAWAHLWVDAVTAVVLLTFWGLRVVRSARIFGRAYLPGSVVRAGLTADGLRLQTGDDLVDTYPLGAARGCHVGRRHVRVDLGRGRPHLFLPRALFPPTELADLQRRVATR